MRWQEFLTACPEFGELADTRFRKDELVILGTVSRDGWPRLSPCELDITAGELFFGMMWQSMKALDLKRDPRLVVHSLPSGKDNPGGDIKLWGTGVDIADPDLRRTYQQAIKARIDWAPDEPEFHLFALDVDRAAYLKFGGGMTLWQWDPERGLRQEERPHG
ncbi:MAG TPA: hypothetical protein VKG85_00280 [Actinomycetes bacterium]|nr:hypothetical protein [Actinomycetes bacterium]